MSHGFRRELTLQPLSAEEARGVVDSMATCLAHLASASVVPCDGQATDFDSLKPPDISVQHYARTVLEGMECSPECFMMAFIYIDRFMCANESCRVTSVNVHRMLLTAVVIAAKVQDDEVYNNDVCASVGGINDRELNSLEAIFLRSIDWRVQVSQAEFREYIELLRLQDDCSHSGFTYQSLSTLALEAKPFVSRLAEINAASVKVPRDHAVAGRNMGLHYSRFGGRRRRRRCCAMRSTGQ